jgi:serine phosphatase RsbU (regulator of sigma subunit)/sensor domain CHASE-containing protein
MRQAGEGGRRSAAVLGLYALVVLGVVATVLAVRDERRRVDQLDAAAADAAATKVGAALEEAVGSLRGVDAIAVDGRVDPEAFQAFARGVVSDSPYPALAFAQVVTPDQRYAFEQANGITIRDTDGAGGLRSATPRDPSIVVLDVYPTNDTTRDVIGFDIAGDPVREKAARKAAASVTPVLSDRTSTVTGARPGVSIVHAVRDRAGGDPLGYVTSGLALDALIRDAGVDVAAMDGFELTMDGEPLVGSSTGGAARSFDIAGRTFRVTADDAAGMGLVMPLLIGLGTVALALVVAWAAMRDRRQRARLTRLSRRNRNIAELGQRFAGSLDASAVLNDLAVHAQTILDAEWSLVVHTTPDAPDGVPVSPLDRAHLDDEHDGLVPDVVRQSLASRQQAAADHPTVAGAALRVLQEDRMVPVVHAICAPLVFTSGWCVGAVAFGWTEPLTAEQAEDRSLAATTVAELASRAAERAVITEVVQERAQQLSAVARTLASARTSDDVRCAVHAGVAPLLRVPSAELVLTDPGVGVADRPGVLERSVKDAHGKQIGCLRIDWPHTRSMTETEEAVLATVSDLIGQTLERTALSDQEHEVIVEFQQALLPDVPTISSLDIASGYSPAMGLVGLGGDFFDVIAVDEHRTILVVGDITGHGAEAVAAMAELKSVIHHLLRSSTTLESTLEQADLLLSRRGVLATALIAEIDTRVGTLSYINAGHPYPVLRLRHGDTRLLSDAHRPLLGLGLVSVTTQAAQIAFGHGDLLLLYTDGLIERRTRHIDDCMDDLAAAVDRMGDGPLDDLLQRVRSIGLATDGRVDDDIALIAVRHG